MIGTGNKVFFRGWLMVTVCLFGVSIGPTAFILGSIGFYLNGFEVVAAGVPACIFAIAMLSLLRPRSVEHLSNLRARTTASTN